MIGEDNRIRAYPQILAKIADKTGSLPYVSHDIIASFNSKFDFFLPGDASIGPTQDDLVATITHEFVHGLGFASFWRPWMANTVTPLITHAEDVFPKTVTIRETIFDAFFARMADGQRLSNFTDALQVAIEGTTYNSQAELDNAITAAAANIKLPTTVDFVTPKAIGFWPKGAQDAILIETSFPEFRNGSTGSHVDKETYQNTENWLMIFDNIPGKTYQQIISDNGATGIVGSGIRAMLESIGHATSQNPTPFIPTPTNELPPLTVTSSRKSKRRQRRRLQ
ncbi:6576_t:CDS:2 [Paraglomus brasilianum]|uniref:6576_t:CDS:1 n=1 Tax=Paraglomus brasilianum TaxID=144538 RepID=A0A9N9DIU8_9GLOM|nr:6576_t:CDS:2 [Paraglomus brasilianum]